MHRANLPLLLLVSAVSISGAQNSQAGARLFAEPSQLKSTDRATRQIAASEDSDQCPPFPAGTLMSAAQLAERDKAKSLSTRASQPAAPLPSKKPAPIQMPALTQNPSPTPGRAITSTPPPPTPATSNLSTSTPQIPTKPNPTSIAPTATNPSVEQLKSLQPAPGKPPSEPAKQPPNKKSYQARLHINMPITGSPPPWAGPPIRKYWLRASNTAAWPDESGRRGSDCGHSLRVIFSVPHDANN